MHSRIENILERPPLLPSQPAAPASMRLNLKRPLNGTDCPPPTPTPSPLHPMSDVPMELVHLPEGASFPYDLTVEEKKRWLKHQQAFSMAARFYRGMLTGLRDEASRRVAEQAWVVLEEHFREFNAYLREKDEKARRRNLLVSLVESTRSQLQNIHGLL